MLTELQERYLPALDSEMQRVVETAPVHTPNYGVMLRYPMGWVNADESPYNQPTGKRVRPILLLLCTEAAGGDWQQALPAAAAVELLHNFSLIHDDIVDDSDTRHGRLAVWKVWGLSNAINAGDGMFALAHVALSNLQYTGVPPEIILRIWSIFNQTTLELTRGQHLDMRFERQPSVTVEDYISMISGKTSALLAACAEIGALIATGDTALASRYAEFGLNIGTAFQIRDDILGIWGDAEITGKSVATDIVTRKKSLPVLYGLEHSEDLQRLYALDEFNDTHVAQAVEILTAVGAREFARQKEAEYYTFAINALSEVNLVGRDAESLGDLIAALVQREY